VDEFCQVFFGYVSAIAAPTLGPYLDVLVVALVVVGLIVVAAASVLVIARDSLATGRIDVASIPSASSATHTSLVVHRLSRARAPSSSVDILCA